VSKLVPVTGTAFVELGIPRVSVAHYAIHLDVAYVDRRCVRRFIRRSREQAKGPLREYWVRKMNALERSL